MKKKSIFVRTLSAVMAVFMLFGCVSASAAKPHQSDDREYDMLPVIYVSGFGATTLAAFGDDGSCEPVFPPSIDGILDYLGNNIGKILVGLLDTIIFGNTDKLAQSLAPLIVDIVDDIALNPDGTSKRSDIAPIVEGAANTSLKAFKDNGMLAYVPYTGSEFLDMECVGDVVGDDKVFNFTYDWRLSHIDNSEIFREYVIDVLELTGAEKVNVYSISQGALIVGAYLYNHAEDGFLNNIVFDTPALEGTDLVTGVFGIDNISLNTAPLGPLLAQILHMEMDLGGILSIIPTDFLNLAFDYGRRDLILPDMMIYGTAFWDMLPTSELEELKAYWLDPVESADVIAKTDALHYGFMSNIRATFDKAEENGAKITIKSGYGIPMIIGGNVNSDGIVNLKYSCGATSAPLGESFDDGYTQVNPGVYLVSPDRTIDLSTAYYPERTWIIKNNVHGQAEWDSRSFDFLMTQLMTKGVEDAYSSYEFPQFMESMAPNDKITFCFTSTNSSFLTYNSEGYFEGKAKITNISKEDTLYIKDISSDFGVLAFAKGEKAVKLAPGESIELTILKAPGGKNISEMKFATVTLTYKTGLLKKAQTADFGITMISESEYPGVTK